MAAGTYLHTSKHGLAFDGVPEGSPTAAWARERRELGDRARVAMTRENEGDRLDRFLAVTDRARGVWTW